MPHTMLEFNERVESGALQTVSPQLQPLRNVYEERLANAEDTSDRFCAGVLLALDCLTVSGRSWDPGLAVLLARLADITWRIPNFPAPGSFFLMASWFAGRPSCLTELNDMLQALKALCPCLDGDEGLGSVLEAVTVFVSTNILGGPEAELPRFYRITQALTTCSTRVGGDCLLKASGSDGHLNNQQVVFFRKASGGTRVYKPRSLAPDLAFYRLLDHFNLSLPEHLRQQYAFPLPEVLRPGPDWGAEEFVTRADDPRTEGKAQIYYYQMGALFFLAKLLGMTDAHQDNIIPTARGPVLIDAECCFQPQVLNAVTLSVTGLFDALSESATADPDRVASAVFQIDSRRSVDVYKHYRKQIMDGFRFARALLTADEPALERFLLGLWHGVDQLRVVPATTAEFVELFGGSVDTLPEPQFLVHPKVVEMLAYLDALLDTPCDRHALYVGVTHALGQCDIPFFCFQLQGGVWRMLCDGQVLATADPFRGIGLPAYLRANLTWLKSNEPEDELVAAL